VAPVEADRLFGKKPGIDPDFDLIMDESLAKNEYPAEKMAAATAAEHTSLSTKFCTPEIWEKYKDLKSSGPAKWTIARAINSGTMHPSSFVGCHAGDRESYDDFKDFFYPVIEAYHKGFSMEKGSDLKGTASERMDPSKIATELSEAAKAKIVSTRIRVARNLSMFPLNPGGSKESREQISEMMGKVYAGLSNEELKGEFFLHTTMSDEQRQALIDGHQLFRGNDRMQAASGYHDHWPHGRGVFHNPDKTFVNWVNEGDHLRIISMESGGDVKAVFSRLSAGAAAIEAGVRSVVGQAEGEIFMMHPKFGSVTCCPSNIGTGMRGSVHIMVPKLIATIGFDAIDKLARERNCQARGSSGEHSAVVDRIDISNWWRIGFPEYELVNDMIMCANFLAGEEDKIPDKPVEANRLFGKKPGIDQDFDLIMYESLAKKEYPAEKMAAATAAEHTSLSTKFCTPEIWEKFKDLKSSGPAKWTMARAIHPSSFVGCHAGDHKSYDDFKGFFYPRDQGVPQGVLHGERQRPKGDVLPFQHRHRYA
jgi:protein-arginine kinase